MEPDRARTTLPGGPSAGRLRRFSDRVAQGLDGLPGMTPNRITAVGLLTALLAALLFAGGDLVLGAVLCAFSYLTDFLDGALARYQEALMTPAERAAEVGKPWLERRGWTEDATWLPGSSFDPLVDKIRYFGALLTLGAGRLWWPLVAAGAAFALALTLVRPLFRRWKVASGRANVLGKLKVPVEGLVLAWLVFLPAATLPTADDALLALATLLGAASLAGQLVHARRNLRNAKAPT